MSNPIDKETAQEIIGRGWLWAQCHECGRPVRIDLLPFMQSLLRSDSFCCASGHIMYASDPEIARITNLRARQSRAVREHNAALEKELEAMIDYAAQLEATVTLQTQRSSIPAKSARKKAKP